MRLGRRNRAVVDAVALARSSGRLERQLSRNGKKIWDSRYKIADARLEADFDALELRLHKRTLSEPVSISAPLVRARTSDLAES